jgi:putative holliday junction resolvase
MQILGIDIGRRRTGVAVGDTSSKIAFPIESVERNSLAAVLERIAQLAKEYGAGLLVVGLPVHASGEAGTEAERIRGIGAQLQEVSGIPVEYWDERFSTIIAGSNLIDAGVKSKKRRQHIDAAAAAVILQGYLNNRESS